MKIKVTNFLQGMHVSRETDLPARYHGANGDEYLLWMREINSEGRTVRQLCCDIIADVKPPERARDTLLALKENRLLLDNPIQPGLPRETILDGTIVDLLGNIKPGFAVDFDLLPKGAKPWLEQISVELSKKLVAFVRLLRWVQNTGGGHEPYRTVGMFWSEDAEEWHDFPTKFGVKIYQPRAINASVAACAKVVEIMENGAHEPVSHDLMREAAELANIAPRSALLVAFSALEAGIKLQLSHMVPDASPLIDRIPSPPVTTLLQEILPEISRSRGAPMNGLPIKREAHDYLKKWVTQRNQVTHGTKHTVSSDDVEKFIRFAKDILYLLDHLRGQSWALEHLESEIWRRK